MIGTKNCQVFFVTVCLTCRRLAFKTQFIFVNCTEFLYKKCLWHLPVMESKNREKTSLNKQSYKPQAVVNRNMARFALPIKVTWFMEWQNLEPHKRCAQPIIK